MKVNIKLDLSPAEARELMGWPDVSQFHEVMLKSLEGQLKDGGSEALATMLQPFMAESQKAFSSYQRLMEAWINIEPEDKEQE